MQLYSDHVYDAAVLGGGITGAALFFVLSRYTTIGSAVLIERRAALGQVNTGPSSNSQTVHFGDIETNYTLEKAARVKAGADMVVRYLEALPGPASGRIFRVFQKMVIGVGQAEVALLTRRAAEFKALFPRIRLIDGRTIAGLEPAVMAGRDPREAIAALFSDDGYTVDYAALAESFVSKACAAGPGRGPTRPFKVLLNTTVTRIARAQDGFRVVTHQGAIYARTVVAALGVHSLLFAKALGYGREFLILPVVGNFYCAGRSLLKGKVYTVQHPKLPFAAIHGDPSVHDPRETSFGPTAKVLPILERRRPETFFDFIRSAGLDGAAARSIASILADPVVLRFVARNFVYDMPVIGRRLFIRAVRKIVPVATGRDFRGSKSLGGIRPQLVDKRQRKLLLGVGEIVGDRIIFNVTPSPGATACLATAHENAGRLVKFLGSQAAFDQERFRRDLGP